MTALSDTLTVSLVLVLLFGSIAIYLYTRIQQAEQRINLLDSIVLEMKMSSEVKSYTELPAGDYDTDTHTTNHNQFRTSSIIPTSEVAEYKSFDESDDNDDSGSQVSSVSSKHSIAAQQQQQQQQQQQESSAATTAIEVDDVEFYKSVLDSQESVSKSPKVNVNYESMNIKELHALAKQRSISGATTMKKQAIIDTLKAQDRSSTSSVVEPGSMGNSSLGSFLETSTFLGQQNDISSKTITIDDE